MKIKAYLIVLVIILMTSISAVPQSNTAQADSNAQEKLTAEQVQQAKKLLEQLVEPKQQTATNTTTATNGKTMADVLDKGIDLFAGYVTSVSDMLQKIAPLMYGES